MEYFRRIRSIVAASTPSEVAGLVFFHLLKWEN
jgi:hypothetical protein